MSERMPESSGTLLVVDDDAKIRDILRKYLAGHGFRVLEAGDVPQARRWLAAEAVDLVLLDLGLPGEDGLTLARYLRESWHGAVIIMSGRSDAVDRVIGLEVGADDYVGKPFDLRELLARVRTVLRRARPAGPAAPARLELRYRFANWLLDTSRRQLTSDAGQPVPLTTGEFDLLLALVEAGGRVCSRDMLSQRIHQRDSGPFDRAIDVQIGRLRQKIEADPAQPQLIRAVRGVGYTLAAPVERA